MTTLFNMEQEPIIDIDNVGPAASKKKKVVRIITFFAVTAVGAAAFIVFSLSKTADSVSIKSYSTSKVYSGQLIFTTEASGTVVLPTQVTLVSTEDGYADKLLTEEGKLVTPEDILAILEVPDLEDEQEELTVSLNQALIELESVRTDYEDALDALEALNEQKEDYELSLEETNLKMDIAIRKQQADSLIVVADITNSFIDFDVYEQYADHLETGGEMTVTIGSSTMKAEIVKDEIITSSYQSFIDEDTIVLK